MVKILRKTLLLCVVWWYVQAVYNITVRYKELGSEYCFYSKGEEVSFWSVAKVICLFLSGLQDLQQHSAMEISQC
jgi:hypothetical protein